MKNKLKALKEKRKKTLKEFFDIFKEYGIYIDEVNNKANAEKTFYKFINCIPELKTRCYITLLIEQIMLFEEQIQIYKKVSTLNRK